jgi:hypothetical protein
MTAYYPYSNATLSYDTLDETSDRAAQSDKIICPLKDNQLTILHAAKELETNDRIPIKSADGTIEKWFNANICIIADKVGAGKSLSVLSIIANKPQIEPRINITSIGNNINIFHKPIYSYIGINVLVVPHGIFKQWSTYLKRDTKLKYYGIKINKDVKDTRHYYKNFDVILVASTQYSYFSNIINKHRKNGKTTFISRLIFDEADSINIPSCPQICAAMYYFITASVSELRRARVKNNGFIKNTFSGMAHTDNNFFKRIVLKNTDDFIVKSFSLQDPLRKIIQCKSPHSLSILTGIINDDIVELINAGDLGGVFEKYNMHISDDISIVKLICKNYFEDLENLQLKYKMKQKMKYKSKNGKEMALKKLQSKIDNISGKIKSIEERIQDTDMCGICLDDFVNKCLTPCCKNVFCFECLSMTLSQKPKCPMCMADIPNIGDIVILDNDDEFKDLHNKTVDNNNHKSLTEMDKIENFEHIIKNRINDNSRLLVFSEYDASFSDMLKILDDNQIPYSKIMGTGAHIDSTITKYKEGKIKCLLLNAKFFGSGLNLENTTDIVIYHRMNPDLKKQVEGRAQRPGRTSQLNIYELLYQNELS